MEPTTLEGAQQLFRAATKTEGGLAVLFERAVVAENGDELLRPLDDAQS